MKFETNIDSLQASLSFHGAKTFNDKVFNISHLVEVAEEPAFLTIVGLS